ncbi:hypothetical protein [Nonomuraea salmonea]|uniref:hypothetical protein n=1 Tax=Nonomuraea salmonea TaxID=46181 RepID=UPI0031E4F320
MLLNYTYLHLTRLGLTPLDRFRTCHLLADAVEDVYGVSGGWRRCAASPASRGRRRVPEVGGECAFQLGDQVGGACRRRSRR